MKWLASSPLFLALALLFLLFLREGINHQEFAVSWIPLGGQIGLVLVWHKNGTFKGLHDGYVNVGLVLLIAAVLRPGQIVPNRLYFLHLGLPGAIQGILGDKVEAFAESEFG